MSRADGRSACTLRPIDIVLEDLDRVDGSASFAFGETKALASVSGPIQVRLASELPSKASFEVTVRPLSGVPGTESRSIATTLRTLLTPSLVLTQNPRTLIQLVVQSLTPALSTSNLSLYAAYINASTLALLRTASFPMVGVVCAAAVGRLTGAHANIKEEKHILDPSDLELQQCDAIGCVAVMFRAPRSTKSADKMDEDNDDYGGEVVWSFFQGAGLQSDYDPLLRLAKTGARSIYDAMRGKLREEILRSGAVAERNAKKMPKTKGGRIAFNVDTDDAMDTI